MPIEMPAGKRFAVCLTFDFDAMSFFFGNDGDFSQASISRGEFDARVGVPRILRFLEESGIPSTWFVPGHTAETWPLVTKAISDAGHEIANHGYCHEAPALLDYAAEERALLRGNEALELITGQRPVGYRPPRSAPSTRTAELLMEHGFLYTANGMSTDYHPYPARVGDHATDEGKFAYGSETSLVEIPSYWYLVDVVQLEHVLAYPSRIAAVPAATEQIWKDEFDFGYEREPGGCITYILHPGGIGRPHRFMMLERLVDHIRQHNDVWFTTCEQIARSWTPDHPGAWAFDANGALQVRPADATEKGA
jgi:peptidoglycan/xylan/chitin deacetylase (PgdA/CDA1 family)